MFFASNKKDNNPFCLILRAVFCAMALTLTVSCGMNGKIRKDPDYTVLVIHSYNDMGQEGSYDGMRE